jgi:hypothetical protein
VLRCLCIGTSCGFTTAQTFSLWQVEQAEVSGTQSLSPFHFKLEKPVGNLSTKQCPRTSNTLTINATYLIRQ